MIRVGEIVKQHNNPYMIVSPGYEELVKKLSLLNFKSDEKKLLACLVISQTEEQYKKYLIRVLAQLKKLPIKNLIQDWEKFDFLIEDGKFQDLFTKEEFEILKDKDLEAHLDDFPNLFEDSLNNAFYTTRKKGMVYIRRLALSHLKNLDSLDNFRKLILYFVVAQMLHSWESSCIHLGMMILEGWSVEETERWFRAVWPVYRVEP